MERQAISRRDLFRSGGALAVAGATGGLSGCLGFLDSDDEVDPGRFAHVPFGTAVALHTDVESILEDDPLREGVNQTLPAELGPYSESKSVEALLDEFQAETGLDARGVSELLSFGGLALDDAATIIWAEWDTTDLTDLLQREVQLEETTHRNRTVYESASSWTAELADGVFVVGAPSTARAAIDLWVDSGDSASQDLQDAYLSSSPGYMRFGLEIPPAVVEAIPGGSVNEPLIEDIKYGYGGLYRDGAERIGELTFQANDSSTAETLESTLFTIVSVLGQEDSDIDLPRAIEAILDAGIDDVTVSRDGDTATLAYRNEASDLGPVMVELVDELRGLLDVTI